MQAASLLLLGQPRQPTYCNSNLLQDSTVLANHVRRRMGALRREQASQTRRKTLHLSCNHWSVRDMEIIPCPAP